MSVWHVFDVNSSHERERDSEQAIGDKEEQLEQAVLLLAGCIVQSQGNTYVHDLLTV